jgi:hypothetical protein
MLGAVLTRALWPGATTEPIPASRSGPDIKALAYRVTPEDRAPTNGSSIAFLLEHRGASALLTADAFASVLQRALAALTASRRQALPWRLDLIKLSQHGSRANTTTKLLETVQAQTSWSPRTEPSHDRKSSRNVATSASWPGKRVEPQRAEVARHIPNLARLDPGRFAIDGSEQLGGVTPPPTYAWTIHLPE